MTTIVTRAANGAPLRNDQVDLNFTNLNDFKVERDSLTGSAYLPTGTTAQRTATPTAGLVRYNSTTQKFEGYGSAWGNLGGGAYIGDTAPSNPGNGDLWWNSTSGHTYVYYGTAWVDLFGGAEGQYLPLTGGTISGNLAYTGTLTGGTGIINIGIGQIYKDASGNVGIGITPANRLHVYGDGSASLLKLQASNTNGNAMMNLVPNGTGNGVIYTETGSLILAPANTNRAWFDPYGSFGLGTIPSSWGSTQTRAFDLAGPGSGIRQSLYSPGATNGGGLANNAYHDGTNWKFLYSSSFPACRFELNAGSFYWYTSNGSGGTGGSTWTPTLAMALFGGGNLVLGDTGTYSANTKLYINGTSDNNLPLNAITDLGTNAGAAALRINSSSNLSTAYFLLTRNSAASFYGLATNGASTFSSDETLKKNFELARDGYLADICKIPVKKYHWKTQDDSEAKEIGWTAQDVQRVFPGMVQESPEGTLMLKGSVMVPILFKALQELTTRLETLEARTA